MIRAKMCLNRIERQVSSKYNSDTQKYESCEGWTLKFNVVTGDGAPDNKEFFNSSPSGSIELFCVNPEANKQMELGKNYFIDFVPEFSDPK